MFESLYDSDSKTWFPKFEFDRKADVLDEIGKVVDKADVELSNSDKAENEQKEKNSIRNKEIADKIFAIFEHYGFHAENKDYGNGYFIINMGDNSVVHFNFKGFWIKDWKFGMWIHSEYLDKDEPCDTRTEKKYPTVEIFSQHKDCIDKFKPSASSICFDIFDDDIREILEMDVDKLDKKSTFDLPYSLWDVFRCIKFMKYHPCMTFSGLCGHEAYKCETKYGYTIDFIYYRSMFHLKNWFGYVAEKTSFFYNMAKMLVLSLNRNIESIVVVDWNAKNEGLRTSYNYEVWVNFNKNASDEKAYRIYSKWFPSRMFGYVNGHFPSNLFEVQEVHRYDSDVDENLVSVLTFRSKGDYVKSINDRIHYYGISGFTYEKYDFTEMCNKWNLEYDGNGTFKVAQIVEHLKLNDEGKYSTIDTRSFFVNHSVSKKLVAEIADKIRKYNEFKAMNDVKSDDDSDDK